ncbi:ArsR/SmtB family transcription factor [Demequina iriomotensis]|uniref:ArsR/SmtB family transcription factor n=1 Tax=Demequina iriomotensis TaxID=1536641 RepID=UPI000785F064|nr:metalloregulator ArsR/SmtB family transcription factor [Demequina iriomotensis]
MTTREDSPELSAASAAVLAAVADPLRHGIVRYLAAQGEQCVCDLQAAFPVKTNLLSYHLKTLREAGLLVSDKRGRWVHYSVAPDAATLLARALPLPATPRP